MALMTGKQCRKARNLLRWNQRDLSARSRVPVKRLDNFEKGYFRLYKSEHDDVMKVFKREGVIFKDNFEVVLSDDDRPKRKQYYQDAGYEDTNKTYDGSDEVQRQRDETAHGHPSHESEEESEIKKRLQRYLGNNDDGAGSDNH